MVIFLYDILLASSSYQECLNRLSLLRKLLENLGFLVIDHKSIGFVIDSVQMKIFLPDNKIQKIPLACQNVISQPRQTIRQLQVSRVTGLLVSVFPAVSCLRLYDRSIE